MKLRQLNSTAVTSYPATSRGLRSGRYVRENCLD
jgi:hypothetical protein